MNKVIWMSLGLLILLTDCAALRGKPASELSAAREEFDPQTLNDDDLLIQPNFPIEDRGAPSPSPAIPSQAETGPMETSEVVPLEIPEAALEQVGGYRVQIIALTDQKKAQEVASEAEQKLSVKAYVAYERSLHLVQVGDCRTEEEAHELLKRVEESGYEAPFVVQTEVWAPPQERVRRVPVPGFRAQIFSSVDREATERVADRAHRVLGTDEVYVQFQPPQYKVTVGNCRTRDEVDDLVKRVRTKGYRDAFWMRTEILVEEKD